MVVWMFALSALLLLIWFGIALYAIVQWIYSDLPRGTRRPWERRRRAPPPLIDPAPVRHPLNAAGPFYTEKGWCLACRAPEAVAPELIGFRDGAEPSDGAYGCFFKKQPGSPEELERALQAMRHSC